MVHPNNHNSSDVLLYYNIVTTERAPTKRKIKARDFVAPLSPLHLTDSSDDDYVDLDPGPGLDHFDSEHELDDEGDEDGSHLVARGD